MMEHELKTDPDVFKLVVDGKKPYDIRFNDRDFIEGDKIISKETFHTGEEMAAGKELIYTGAESSAIVTHVLHGPIYGLKEGWVIMSIGYIDYYKTKT